MGGGWEGEYGGGMVGVWGVVTGKGMRGGMGEGCMGWAEGEWGGGYGGGV